MMNTNVQAVRPAEGLPHLSFTVILNSEPYTVETKLVAYHESAEQVKVYVCEFRSDPEAGRGPGDSYKQQCCMLYIYPCWRYSMSMLLMPVCPLFLSLKALNQALGFPPSPN